MSVWVLITKPILLIFVLKTQFEKKNHQLKRDFHKTMILRVDDPNTLLITGPLHIN